MKVIDELLGTRFPVTDVHPSSTRRNKFFIHLLSFFKQDFNQVSNKVLYLIGNSFG